MPAHIKEGDNSQYKLQLSSPDKECNPDNADIESYSNQTLPYASTMGSFHRTKAKAYGLVKNLTNYNRMNKKTTPLLRKLKFNKCAIYDH